MSEAGKIIGHIVNRGYGFREFVFTDDPTNAERIQRLVTHCGGRIDRRRSNVVIVPPAKNTGKASHAA